MKKYLITLIIVGVVAAFAFVNSGKVDSPSDAAGHSEPVSEPDRAALMRGAIPSKDHVLFSKNGLSRIATYSFHEKGIDFYTREVVPEGRFSWEKSVTTPLEVEFIAARIAEDVFVAGLDSLTSDIVIERWSYTPPTGSLASSHSLSPPVLGQSVPLLSTVVAVAGGVFVAPSERTLPQPSKQTLYRGSDFAGVHSMVIDPEGRFLLVQDSSTYEVFQVVPGSPPVKIISKLDYPELDSTFGLQAAYQLGNLERVFALTGWPPAGGTQVIILHDSNNDGNFEPPLNFDFNGFMDAYPDKYGDPSNPWEFMT